MYFLYGIEGGSAHLMYTVYTALSKTELRQYSTVRQHQLWSGFESKLKSLIRIHITKHDLVTQVQCTYRTENQYAYNGAGDFLLSFI